MVYRSTQTLVLCFFDVELSLSVQFASHNRFRFGLRLRIGL